MNFKLVTILLLLAGVAFGAVNTADTKKMKIALVLDKGGRDDKSFNSAAFKGANDAQKKYGFSLKVIESQDDNAIEPSMRSLAQKDFDLIVGIGYVQQDAIKKVAASFPKKQFVLVDAHVDLPNVRSVVFKEHEGSYLVGAVAALTSKTHKVGFIGGMKIPLIQRFLLGYEDGAKKTVAGTEVMSDFVGTDSNAWRNPAKGKEIALSMYGKQADIVFAAAGASALGAFDAAEQTKKFIIGCDSNQNWIKPGLVLTSMLKKVDVAVEEAIDMKMKNQFKGGKFTLGLKDGAIDFAVDSYNKPVLKAEVEKKVNEIKKQIISGKIKVPDYYEINRTNVGS